ncbi:MULTISPECIES: type 1 fimbrial protein [unclassified Pseudomonas]|uniref:type 1 fimbrial protein n=1 Tax=unclassified Pseudomonas TaxID=196821 RepID=UPI00273E84AA|nr:MULTISPECIES: type 1 fimbrial protein [unclassified Pseudomonas]
MAASQGVISFSGSLVDGPCATNARSSASMELTGCTTASHDTHIDVRKVATVAGIDAASARLVSQARVGRYYDQQYQLVDSLGMPIQSGAYVITLTSP